MSSSSGSSKLVWSILVPVVYLILITIIILGYLQVLTIPLESVLIIVYVGLGFTVLLVVAFIVQKVYKNKKKQEAQITTNIGSTPQRQNRSTLQYQTTTKDETKDKITIKNIEALQVSIENDQDTNCGICKLEIRKHQLICTCPQCGSLFHREHIEDWLHKEDKCPVCGFNIKEYLEEFSR